MVDASLELLYKGIKCGSFEMVEKAIHDDEDVVDGIINYKTPLYIALEEPAPSKEIIKLLIDSGADVNILCYDKMPLHVAAGRGMLFAVELIIKYNADINYMDWEGRTALFDAIANRDRFDIGKKKDDICSHHFEVIQYLIEKGADMNLKTNHGNVPLFIAISTEDDELLSLLIEKGADVNMNRISPHNLEWNLVMEAMWHNYENGVRMLIDAGATAYSIPYDTGIAKQPILDIIECNLGEWEPRKHPYRPKKTRDAIKTVLMLANRDNCLFRQVPRDILLVICRLIAK